MYNFGTIVINQLFNNMENTYRFTLDDEKNNEVVMFKAECKNMYDAFLTAKAIQKKEKHLRNKKLRIIGIINETQLLNPFKKGGVINE